MQNKTIRLSNLPSTVVETDVYVFLQAIENDIEFVHITDQSTAFVSFKHTDEAENALLYDGQNIGDNEIGVELADAHDSEYKKFEMIAVAHHLQTAQNAKEERQKVPPETIVQDQKSLLKQTLNTGDGGTPKGKQVRRQNSDQKPEFNDGDIDEANSFGDRQVFVAKEDSPVLTNRVTVRQDAQEAPAVARQLGSVFQDGEGMRRQNNDQNGKKWSDARKFTAGIDRRSFLIGVVTGFLLAIGFVYIGAGK